MIVWILLARREAISSASLVHNEKQIQLLLIRFAFFQLFGLHLVPVDLKEAFTAQISSKC